MFRAMDMRFWPEQAEGEPKQWGCRASQAGERPEDPADMAEIPAGLLEALTPKALGQLVLRRIHRVAGVEATDTRMVVEL